jgi:hypothetical protein
MQLSKFRCFVAILVMMYAAVADARLLTPAAGLNVASVTVFNGTQWAVVTFSTSGLLRRINPNTGNEETNAGRCTNTSGMPFAETNAAVFDISTESGKASLNLANAALLSGKRIYLETFSTCPLGNFMSASLTSLK